MRLFSIYIQSDTCSKTTSSPFPIEMNGKRMKELDEERARQRRWKRKKMIERQTLLSCRSSTIHPIHYFTTDHASELMEYTVQSMNVSTYDRSVFVIKNMVHGKRKQNENSIRRNSVEAMKGERVWKKEENKNKRGITKE